MTIISETDVRVHGGSLSDCYVCSMCESAQDHEGHFCAKDIFAW